MQFSGEDFRCSPVGYGLGGVAGAREPSGDEGT